MKEGETLKAFPRQSQQATVSPLPRAARAPSADGSFLSSFRSRGARGDLFLCFDTERERLSFLIGSTAGLDG